MAQGRARTQSIPPLIRYHNTSLAVAKDMWNLDEYRIAR